MARFVLLVFCLLLLAPAVQAEKKTGNRYDCLDQCYGDRECRFCCSLTFREELSGCNDETGKCMDEKCGGGWYKIKGCMQLNCIPAMEECIRKVRLEYECSPSQSN